MASRSTASRSRTTARPRPSKTTKAPGKGDVIKVINVRIGRLPGVIHDVALDGGRKIKDAMGAIDLTPGSGEEIRLNGRKVTGYPDLKEGDKVYLLRKLTGN